MSGNDLIRDGDGSSGCVIDPGPPAEFGRESDQVLDGGPGNDTIAGAGLLRGRSGGDTLTLIHGDADGGSGADTAVSPLRLGILLGGSGDDVIVYHRTHPCNVSAGGSGFDTCTPNGAVPELIISREVVL